MKNNQNGQSTIEFIFTFIFGVSVIMLIFNSAMSYTTGYLAHYATFMASRTYLTYDSFIGSFADIQSSLNGGEQKAMDAFSKYRLDLFGINSSNFAINRPQPGGDYVSVGTMTTFNRKMDAIGKIAGQTTMTLVSESFLGKEPTRATCANRVCKAVTNQENCTINMDVTLFDDGC